MATPRLATAAIALILAGTASLSLIAQESPERSGAWFHAGAGLGSEGCNYCGSRETSITGAAAVGFTLSPHVRAGLGATAYTRATGGQRLTTGTLTATFRFYPRRRGGFFMLAGVGAGMIRLQEADLGRAAVLGLGHDLRVGRAVSLTPFLNGYAVANERDDSNVLQVGLGVTVD